MRASTILDSIVKGKGTHEFIPTGFPKLDNALDGGLLRKELVILGGSTGAGKSYLAIHLAMKAIEVGFKVGYFSLEISNELVVARMMGMKAGIKASHILYGIADETTRGYKESKAFVMGVGDLLESYDDTYELARIEEIMRANKFDMVVVDFIQNVIASRGDEYERLSHVSLHLQRIAKQTNSCIVVLSQLSNMVSSKGVDDRPLEYKGSGSIATVADLGFFLAKGDPDLQLHPDVEDYILMLAKNRRGASKVATALQVTWGGGTFNEKS